MHKKIDSTLGMSYFGVVFNAGGVWEEKGRRGCSHLMEHLMCKTYEHLYPKMRRLDVADNAMTSDNKVVFYASGLDECVAQVSQDMLDGLTEQTKLWSKEQFDTEKKIVLQEYGDCFNYQLYGALENAMRINYGFYSAIGLREDIENFTYEDSLVMAKEVFSKPRMIVTVGDHSVSYKGEFRFSIPKQFASHGKYDVEQEVVPKEDQTVVALIHNDPLNIKQATTYNLLRDCLALGLESPLYQEIREKRGLAYAVYFFESVINNDIVPIVAAQTANENAKELSDSFENFFCTSMSDLISVERFNDCRDGLLYRKRKVEILPYKGVLQTEIADYNPFEGLEDVSREDVLSLGEELLDISKFELVQS